VADDDVLDEVDALLRGSSAARRGGRGGIVQTPDVDVLARLRDTGPAGMANVALCAQTGRTEAFMAIMLKHARELGLVELSVPRDQRAAHRLTDLGWRWVEASLRRREQLPEPESEVIEGAADEIRDLPPG
jgi:hypothetical protein